MRIVLAVAALLAATSVAGAQAVTTRIETRPYYGAVTTIEHGVRVMRALPPHDRIIINPNGAAPVSIQVGTADAAPTIVQQQTNETRVYRPATPYVGVPVGPRRPLPPQAPATGQIKP